jgi:hypothetical protein
VALAVRGALLMLLHDIILYIVSRFPRGVGRTRLMKLLFLVDAFSARELGRGVTGVEWRRWRYGPFSREVLDALDELVDAGLLAVDVGPEARYVALREPPALPEEVRRVVDRVVEEYGFLPLRELLSRVYEEYGISGLGMGERIRFDWDSEVLGLAEDSGRDRDAVIELAGRLYEEYRDVFDVVPRNLLALYVIAAAHLSARDPKRLRDLTRNLLDLLEDVKKYLERHAGSNRAPLPPEVRRKAGMVYNMLLDAAAKAVEG